MGKNIILLAAIGFIIAIVLALNSGWKSLAKAYPGPKQLSQQSSIQWIDDYFLPETGVILKVGTGQSRKKIWLGANKRGIFIRSLSIWTALGPPLFVPWSDINVHWQDINLIAFKLRQADFSFKRVPTITMSVSEPYARQLLNNAPKPATYSQTL